MRRPVELLSVLLCLCCVSVTRASLAQSSITQRDSLALISLFESTGGENWTTQDGDGPRSDWVYTGNDPERPRPPFAWHGVDMDGFIVQSLRLSSVGITGTIPDGLGNLTAPIRLSLQGNSGTRGNLYGSIPDTLGSLASLEQLYLANNNLSGSIPERLSNLTGLQQLNLSDNVLTGTIPDSLGRLTALTLLDLSGNQLSGQVPESFSGLVNLNHLILDENRLSGEIPAGLAAIDSLVTLRLVGLPDGTSNRISGPIPVEIGQIESLRFLYLDSNVLEGPIPDELGRLRQLERLHLTSNQLTGVLSDSLTKLTKLKTLDVRFNDLDGRIPEAIGQLADLEELRISGNRIEGAVPPSFLSLTNLGRIDLDYNRLDSLVDFSGFTELYQIRLAGNRFTFRDLEPLADFASDPEVTIFEYAPQDSVDLIAEEEGGDTILLTFEAGGSNTDYTWFRNGEEIDGETGSELLIPASSRDMYRAEARHPDLPLLVLHSRPYGDARIIVNSEGNDGLDPMADEGTCDTGEEIVRSIGGVPILEQECTLRAAIELANLTPRDASSPHRIEFDIPGSGLPEIEPVLPVTFDVEYDLRSTTPVIIDGTTQDGGFVALIGYDGDVEEEGLECGLELRAAGSRIRGFLFRRFQDNDFGLCLAGEGGIVAEYNEFDDLEDGLSVRSPSNIVRNNRFVRAAAYSLEIAGQNADGNLVLDNEFGGEERSGSHVVIRGADDNIIRGNRIYFAAGAISNGWGIAIICGRSPNGCSGNQVVGNELALNIKGVVLQGDVGVRISRNVFVENFFGVELVPQGGTSTEISDNWFGIDSTLTSKAGNGIGILHRGSGAFTISGNTIVDSQSSGIQVGFPELAQIVGNRIGGNSEHGIHIQKGAKDIRIESNLIGAEVGSSYMTGNGFSGIRIENAQRTVVLDNVITGNGDAGLLVTGDLSEGTLIRSNRIGLDNDAAQIGNGTWGVRIEHAPNSTMLDNVISANGRSGLSVEGESTRRTTISDNRVGTDNAGNDPFGTLGNGERGIELIDVPAVTIEESIVAGNGTDGILLEDVTLAGVQANTIRLNETGIRVVRGGEIAIVGNLIERNLQRGVDASDDVVDLVIRTNTVRDQQGISTGIHLSGTAAIIEDNQITGDAGDAVTLESGASANISGNNIFDNAGFGVNNLVSSTIVSAGANWWGDSSGPAGAGAGMGQSVSEGVDFSGWLESPASVTLAAPDTVLLPVAGQDTVRVFAHNLAVPNDVLDVTIVDGSGWISGPASFTVDLTDGTGTAFSLPVSVPAGPPNGTVHDVEINVSSQSNPTDSDSATLVLLAEARMVVDFAAGPGNVQLAVGDSLAFEALAFDQFGSTVDVSVIWSATGGAIDGDGLYIAGTVPGSYMVTAEASGTGLTIELPVEVVTSVGVESPDPEIPDIVLLEPNYPNPFTTTTNIPFSLPEPSPVRLIVYDLIGREVATLVDGVLTAGHHSVRFNAGRIPGGVYFYRLTASGSVRTGSMVRIR